MNSSPRAVLWLIHLNAYLRGFGAEGCCLMTEKGQMLSCHPGSQVQPSSGLCSSREGAGWVTENTRSPSSVRVTWGCPVGHSRLHSNLVSLQVLSDGFRDRSSCLLWTCEQKCFLQLTPYKVVFNFPHPRIVGQSSSCERTDERYQMKTQWPKKIKSVWTPSQARGWGRCERTRIPAPWNKLESLKLSDAGSALSSPSQLVVLGSTWVTNAKVLCKIKSNIKYRKIGSCCEMIMLTIGCCCVQLFAPPWAAAGQTLLPSTVSKSLLQFMSAELVTLPNCLSLCCPLLQ